MYVLYQRSKVKCCIRHFYFHMNELVFRVFNTNPFCSNDVSSHNMYCMQTCNIVTCSQIQLTSEQELFENEFADNEDDGHAYQPPSLINESSFGVFHDSWAAGNGGANMSKSAVGPPPSSQKNSSLLTKSVVGPLHSSQKNSSLLSKSAVGLPPSSQQKNSSLLSKSAVTQSSIVKNSSKLSSKSVIVSSNIPKKSTQVGKSALPRVEAGPPPAAKRQ